MNYKWTVKSNSEVGQWTESRTLGGAKRAARSMVNDVISPTQAVIVDAEDENRIIARLGWCDIFPNDKWITYN